MATSALPPQQEMAALHAQRGELTRGRRELLAELADWDAQLALKREIVEKLQNTVAELQKDGGSSEGLPRCAAEVQQQAAAAQNASAIRGAAAESLVEGAGAESAAGAAALALEAEEAGQSPEPAAAPSSTALAEDMMLRLAAAVAKGASAPVVMGWEAEDFDREFGEPSDPSQQFLEQLTEEQRLLWELQNPPEHSLRTDRKLLGDLTASGKLSEVNLLLAASGAPTLKELQYRALLWLRHRPKLDTSYVEEAMMSTSLLGLACGKGFDDVARELLERRADANRGDAEGRTPLMLAAATDSLHACRALVHAGADVGAKDRQGATASLVAARGGHGELSKWLDAAVGVEASKS